MLFTNRGYARLFAPSRSKFSFPGSFLSICLLLASALSLLAPQQARSQVAPAVANQRPESELIFEGEGSFGHYHIFADSWWSNLYTGGVEYDRNNWGYFLGAQMDYVAEVLPVTILIQPAKTDVFGDPLTTARQVVPGLAISPVGLRMKWNYKGAWQPYFIAKGGVIGFPQKVLSSDATYEDFLLQLGIGIQRRITDRFDIRVGYSDVHFSDAFMVPSNPGLDVMSYNGGIVYRLGGKR